MKKKWVSFLMALAIMAGLLPVSAFAATAYDTEALAAYNDIVQGIISEVGYAQCEYDETLQGLADVGLFDFDRDGIEELGIFWGKGNVVHFQIYTYKNGHTRGLVEEMVGAGGYYDYSVERQKNISIVVAGGRHESVPVLVAIHGKYVEKSGELTEQDYAWIAQSEQGLSGEAQRLFDRSLEKYGVYNYSREDTLWEGGLPMAGLYYNKNCDPLIKKLKDAAILNAGKEPSGWASAEVAEAKNSHLIPQGLDSRYQAPIVRLEFARLCVQLLMEFTGKTERELLQAAPNAPIAFSDTNDSAVKIIQGYGITNGSDDGKFLPDNCITREEAATMLARLLAHFGYSSPAGALSFADKGACSNWAQDAIVIVSNMADASGKKIMGGVGENRFSPKSNYTIEQAICSFVRLYHILSTEKTG